MLLRPLTLAILRYPYVHQDGGYPRGPGGEFFALNSAVNQGRADTDQGLRESWLAQYSGFRSSGFGDQGTGGRYWSLQLAGASPFAGYALQFTSSSVNADGTVQRHNGIAVRCVAV